MAKDVFGAEDSVGEVQIASEAVAAIAGISAAEVDGIESMVGGIAGKLGGKNNAKGVKLNIEGNKVSMDIAVNMQFGYSIPKISAKVQEKVSQAVNSMTGLQVEQVNVRVAGIVSSDSNN